MGDTLKNISDAACNAQKKALTFGDSDLGKSVKLYGALLGSLLGGIAVILQCIAPIVKSHVETSDRIREARAAVELEALKKQVASNSVSVAETAVKVRNTEVTVAATAAKVESNAAASADLKAAVRYVGGPEVVETAKTVEWANAPAPTK